MFGRTEEFRKAAVFFNSLPESFFLQSSAETRIILHGSQNWKGIQNVQSELYNTVEVKNYAE